MGRGERHGGVQDEVLLMAADIYVQRARRVELIANHLAGQLYALEEEHESPIHSVRTEVYFGDTPSIERPEVITINMVDHSISIESP